MKRAFYVMLVAVMIITACQPKTKIVPVDMAAAKDSVTKVLEKFYSAMEAKDTSTVFALLANDGLYCGTDSKELWDKSTLSNSLVQMFADTSYAMKYSIDKREIRVAADGNTAISIEQFFVKEWSQKMPVRMVYHLMKTGNGWIIDFSSTSFIPNNEDLGKLFKALE
jgi:ketosteroid isomerase-like protein